MKNPSQLSDKQKALILIIILLLQIGFIVYTRTVYQRAFN